jgi:hypothetical protein
MCHTLVHELSHDQPNTTKELPDTVTRHATGEEAVGAAFVLVPSKATNRGTKKGAKDGKNGQMRHPR